MNEQREQQACKVLQLMMQHSRTANTPKQLCTLLQVSSHVNAALRQCRGTCSITTRVSSGSYSPYPPGGDICTPMALARFCAWLPEHAGLVNSITLYQGAMYSGCYHGEGSYYDMMDEPSLQLLESALQLSTGPQQGPAMAGQAAPQRLLLQLERFHSDYVLSPRGLAALTASKARVAVLRYRQGYVRQQHVDQVGQAAVTVTVLRRHPTTSPAFCAAVGQLTTLQELDLQCSTHSSEPPNIPAQLLSAVGKLQMLTSLRCDGLDRRSTGLLPVGLRDLDVAWAEDDSNYNMSDIDGEPEEALALVDMSHLTSLEKLRWRRPRRCSYGAAPGAPRITAILPQQLTFFDTGVVDMDVVGWDKVETLYLSFSYGDTLDMLHQLPCTNLQHLDLDIKGLLALHSMPMEVSMELSDAMLALGTLTSLTALSMRFADKPGRGRGLDRVPLCASLSNLCNLQRFRLSVPWEPDFDNTQDLMQLTVLTQLKDLSLQSPALDDFSMVALLSSLMSLQHLQLTSCNVRTSAFVPVLAALTGLTWLELADERRMGYSCSPFKWRQYEALHLSKLTKLEQLVITPSWRGYRELVELLPRLPRLAPRRRHRPGYNTLSELVGSEADSDAEDDYGMRDAAGYGYGYGPVRYRLPGYGYGHHDYPSDGYDRDDGGSEQGYDDPEMASE